jgi:hypothetical protein
VLDFITCWGFRFHSFSHHLFILDAVKLNMHKLYVQKTTWCRQNNPLYIFTWNLVIFFIYLLFPVTSIFPCSNKLSNNLKQCYLPPMVFYNECMVLWYVLTVNLSLSDVIGTHFYLPSFHPPSKTYLKSKNSGENSIETYIQSFCGPEEIIK